MEKMMMTRKCSTELWFGILISFVLCFILLCFDYSTLLTTYTTKSSTTTTTTLLPKHHHQQPTTIQSDQTPTAQDPCSERYIFIQKIPKRFNRNLLTNCSSLTRGTDMSDMCPYFVNLGLGTRINTSLDNNVFPNGTTGWFKTNQFMLELIFHNKMKRYKCLTRNSSLASAIYIPFYAGFDISHYLWNPSISARDSSAREFLDFVSRRPEWERLSGRDHFFVAGRIAWDFRRKTDEESDWGSKLRFLPESHNMTMLSVESSSWKNDFAIPYPTYFHPSSSYEVHGWQKHVLGQNRTYLFTFAGGPRPDRKVSIRNMVVDQCRDSKSCYFMDCSADDVNCDDPFSTMQVFQNSVFCLQPPGDSHTRRSIFDSISAGCIPVFFHPGTAYAQYLWHFPEMQTDYSVYIPVRDAGEWDGRIEDILNGISKEREVEMRENVVGMIPGIVYADPRSKIKDFEDAFDVSVGKILERVEGVRKRIREGKDPGLGFDDPDDYKYTFSNYFISEN